MNPSIVVQPYLAFGGRTAEAIEFYKTALGAEVDMILHFKDMPKNPEKPAECQIPPGYEDKVMHASFRVGGSTIMASDGGCGEATSFKGFSLSITQPTEADCDRVFNALADGGNVEMPLGKTFWSPCFGMVTDRFGLCWMVSVPG